MSIADTSQGYTFTESKPKEPELNCDLMYTNIIGRPEDPETEFFTCVNEGCDMGFFAPKGWTEETAVQAVKERYKELCGLHNK